MRLWQTIALVLFPAASAVVLEILTSPLRARARDEAAQVIGGMLSDDAVEVADTLAALAQGSGLPTSNLLDWLFGGVVILGMALPVWILPPAGESRTAVSALTSVFCGHVLARFLMGYHRLTWTEMGLYLLIGAVVGLMGFLMRPEEAI